MERYPAFQMCRLHLPPKAACHVAVLPPLIGSVQRAACYMPSAGCRVRGVGCRVRTSMQQAARSIDCRVPGGGSPFAPPQLTWAPEKLVSHLQKMVSAPPTRGDHAAAALDRHDSDRCRTFCSRLRRTSSGADHSSQVRARRSLRALCCLMPLGRRTSCTLAAGTCAADGRVAQHVPWWT